MKLTNYFICCIVLLTSVSISAEEQDFWVLTNPEAPFVVEDDKRQLSGYVVDLVRGVLAQAEVSQNILTAPWERVELEARTKSNVLVFALARTPEREEHYHWVTPITANIFAIYAKNSLDVRVDSLTQLDQLNSIAVLQGDVREKILNQYQIRGAKPYMSWQKAFDSLLRGRSQALFFSDAGMAFFCENAGTGCNDISRLLTYQRTQSYLVLSKPGTNPELVSKLTEAAKQFKASDDFKHMAQTWVKKYKQEVTIPMHLEDGVLNLWNK